MDFSTLIPETIQNLFQQYDLSFNQLGWLFAGVMVGGFVNGLAGFGTA